MQPKIKLLIALLLGLLTFIITPLIVLVVAICFYFLGKFSETYNPIFIVADIFGLRELAGFFAAQIILIGLLAFFGNLAVAIISWRVIHSKRLAVVTFVSAIIFQSLSILVKLPISVNKSQAMIKWGIESEKAYQHFAKFKEVSFEVLEPYSDIEIGNRHPEYGPKYKKLNIFIPIFVSREGTYLVNVSYGFSKAGESGRTRIKEVSEIYEKGDHLIKVEFLAHEVTGYGFWYPAIVGGLVDIQLYYLASERELFDKIRTDPMIDKENVEQFFKVEGLEAAKAGTKPRINKFIEKKEIHF